MTKRALVTGGAGFIGSHMCDLLLSRGYNVDVVDDLSSGKRENVPGAARLHVFDVRSIEAARLVAEVRFDLIIHFAAQMDVRKSVADPLFDASVNVIGTLSLLEALRGSAHAKATRFIFVSTGGAVYGDLGTPPNIETATKEPESPYAISKLSVEYYLSYYARIHGMDTACVRYANVYGPRQDMHGEAGVVCIFCNRILDGRPLTIFGDGEQTRDYVYVTDVVEATYAVAMAMLPAPSRLDTRSYNVGTAVETSVLDLSSALGQVSGCSPLLEFLPKRPGEQLRSVLSVDKAREQLGWSPQVKLADGLAQTYEWFRVRYRSPDPVSS